MLITINSNDDVPIYLQIRQQIINGIASGELKAGDSLPSVRQLANDVGVNMHTVNKVYALLRSEGHVNMLGRKGAVIAERSTADERNLNEIRLRMEQLIKEAKVKGVSAEEINKMIDEILNNETLSNETLSDEKGASK